MILRESRTPSNVVAGRMTHPCMPVRKKDSKYYDSDIVRERK